jgi:signal peptidase I
MKDKRRVKIKGGKFQGAIREWVESIITAFILAMVIRAFIVQPFKIPSGSMRPTLLEGDIILVSKFIYGAKIPFTKKLRLPAFMQPKRGDVIVFIYPEDRKKNYIKRLVAAGGETIEIKSGSIYIDGQPVSDSVFNQRYYYNRQLLEEGQKTFVPNGSFFVLGDNSASSVDSRYWGFVPEGDILGKAMVIYWPPNRIRMIK